MKNKWIVFLLIAPLIALLAAGIKVYYKVYIEKPTTTFPVTITIERGDGLARINQTLFTKKLINSKRLFHRYVQRQTDKPPFKSGNFTFKEPLTLAETYQFLITAGPDLITLTIPEGKNIFEIAQQVSQVSRCEKELFIKNSLHLEGQLFPSTYFLSGNENCQQLIEMMTKQFAVETEKLSEWNQLSEKRRKELLILASIVEKETGAAFERATIAGVFFNRLKKRMPLQSDPTAIYGVWDQYRGNITKKHLQAINDYNTYTLKGLPQGPICSPGIDAIKAVLNPEDHNYLYFVSRNDGTHIFSTSYEMHKKAVAEYQLNRKNREGKSWRNLSKP